MKPVFVDTFFWVALTSPADSRFQDASRFERFTSEAPLITCDEVLVEFLSFFSKDRWHKNRAAATVTAFRCNTCAAKD